MNPLTLEAIQTIILIVIFVLVAETWWENT